MLVMFGAGLIVILALTDTRLPAGAVLVSTATPPPRTVDVTPEGAIDPGEGVSTVPRPSATTGALAPASAAAEVETPVATPPPRPTPAPATSNPATPRPGANGDRMAVLTPCPGQPDCFIYRVRRGDNLASIANWFGIPYAEVLSLNPGVRDPRRVHAGDRITLPRPRR
jgi:hypothetical protein